MKKPLQLNPQDIPEYIIQNNGSALFYSPPVFKNESTYFFRTPADELSFSAQPDLKKLFIKAEEMINDGLTAYLLMDYEAGYLFERKLHHLIDKQNPPRIKFVFFEPDEVFSLSPSDIFPEKISFKNFRIDNFSLDTKKEEFIASVIKIKKYIEAGDTYQVNYTIKGEFGFSGSYTSLFYSLIFNQSAAYTALIHNEEELIISLSPELFFCREGDRIYSRPMKGTIKRGVVPAEDRQKEFDLSASEKTRAENVMIVDLIRNDIGRISKYGSVKVPALFTIEMYESLFQMTSTIEGTLNPGINLFEIFHSLFPCGSVTGAPKIRTMEIINEIEKQKRRLYTGSIGILTKDKIKMNVAIRTVLINSNTGKGEIGIGSGIVWDSVPEEEFDESKLKSKFLTGQVPYFQLLESVGVQNRTGLFTEEHINRLKTAADYFLFDFDEDKVRSKLRESINNLPGSGKFKLKLLLDKWGRISTDAEEISSADAGLKVIVSEKQTLSTDKFRYYKTTNRKIYDDELRLAVSKGFDEVIFFNEKGYLTEGSFTNILLRKKGEWFTPPLADGILPGIARGNFLKRDTSVKQISLNRNDLLQSDEVYLINSVRGLMKVESICFNPLEFKKYD